MNQIYELMTRVHVTPTGLLAGAAAFSCLLGCLGLWSLWKVRQALKIMPAFDERLTALTNSVSLLTDTTESCFRALSMQLQFMQSQQQQAAARPAPGPRPVAAAAPVTEASARKSRQRRIVGAARRGEALAAIAAREEVAESEVALRLQVEAARPRANDAQPTQTRPSSPSAPSSPLSYDSLL